jgi:hypothetical protein
MPETTAQHVEIDAAVEQVVKASADRDALTEAVRGLAGMLGYRLVADAPEPPAAAMRRAADALRREAKTFPPDGYGDGWYRAFAALLETVANLAALTRAYDDDGIPGATAPTEIEIAAYGAALAYLGETAPRDGEHGTCARCGQPIEYLGEPYGAWWTHKSAPADGHGAELGGPA